MAKILIILLLVLCGCSDTESHSFYQQYDWSKNGIAAIEFFDSKVGLNLPYRSISICSDLPCDYIILDTLGNSHPQLQWKTLESELRSCMFEVNTRMPEKGRMVLGIFVDSAAHKKDILSLVIPVLERYALSPDTVEIISNPEDSIFIHNNNNWRLVSDDTTLRHLTTDHVQRFVRK